LLFRCILSSICIYFLSGHPMTHPYRQALFILYPRQKPNIPFCLMYVKKIFTSKLNNLSLYNLKSYCRTGEEERQLASNSKKQHQLKRTISIAKSQVHRKKRRASS
jgi:hypothetical protein